MGEDQEPAEGAERAGSWVVKEPGARDHARCLLGLGLTHCCDHSFLILESPSSSHSGDKEFWSDSGPVKPAAPTLAGYEKGSLPLGRSCLSNMYPMSRGC